jgi:hypothetical protein
MIRRTSWKQAACVVVLCAMPLLTLALGAQEEKTVSTKEDFGGLFVGGIACLGEPVVYNTTIHLLRRTIDNQIVTVHGNQIHAEAYGYYSGQRFVFGGSPANLVPAGDGNFLYHLTFIGPGANAPKYSITAKGMIGLPALEVIEEHCVNPVVP